MLFGPPQPRPLPAPNPPPVRLPNPCMARLPGGARDIRPRFLTLGRAASLWHWQKLQTEEACLRKAEDTVFPGLHAIVRGARSSTVHLRSEDEKEAHMLRATVCPEPQQPRRTATLFVPAYTIRWPGCHFLQCSVAIKGSTLPAASSNPWDRPRCGARQRLLDGCSRSLATFFCMTREDIPGAIRGTPEVPCPRPQMSSRRSKI